MDDVPLLILETERCCVVLLTAQKVVTSTRQQEFQLQPAPHSKATPQVSFLISDRSIFGFFDLKNIQGDFVEAAGKVFAIAGNNFKVELYNKTSKIWYMLPEDMSPLFPAEQKSFLEFTATWIGGKVYTFGGEIIRDGLGANFSQTDKVYTMDIDNYKWSTYGES